MDVDEALQDDGEAQIKYVATKTERLVGFPFSPFHLFTWFPQFMNNHVCALEVVGAFPPRNT